MLFYRDTTQLLKKIITALNPALAVKEALAKLELKGQRIFVLAIGKASWPMAQAASEFLGEKLTAGLIITKTKHSQGPLTSFEIYEAGHPLPDENSLKATKWALGWLSHLNETDLVLVLLSGGGSSLFELSELPLDELIDINEQLLNSGASINEINAIRRRLSLVKAGRLAVKLEPAQVISLIISDVIGNDLLSIASGLTVSEPQPLIDLSPLLKQYHLKLSKKAQQLLKRTAGIEVKNAVNYIISDISCLTQAASQAAKSLGYQPLILSQTLTGSVSDNVEKIKNWVKEYAQSEVPVALILAGESTIQVTGTGLGGRNQHLALSLAEFLSAYPAVAIFTFGTDGTDGPTDAAGGYVDSKTANLLNKQGLNIQAYLANFNAYPALKASGGLLITGPTGTNLNDLTVILINNTQTK